MLGRSHLASRLERRRSTVEQAIASYAALAIVVTPSNVPAVVQADPDDDHVIAAAAAARAALLVTGDRDLLDMVEHAGIRIVTPAQAVSLVRR